jgi:hypothetical protein
VWLQVVKPSKNGKFHYVCHLVSRCHRFPAFPKEAQQTNLKKAEQLAEEYDVVILGTGLTECILSGLVSVEGKKVLHLDRNAYYGGECASLSLSQMFEKYRPGTQPPEALGRDRDWAIDQIPRFSMASGEFVKILVYTDVTRYLEFKQIAGSYVFKEGKIAKVPASEAEAISSPLMGMFEKRRLQKFMEFIQKYRFDNPATQQVATGGFFSSATTRVDLNSISMNQLYELFGLEPGTQDFIGHALALHSDDTYKQVRNFWRTANVESFQLGIPTIASFCTCHPWQSTASLPIFTPCTDWVTCLRVLHVCLPFTVVHTCWKPRSKRLK